VKNTPQRAPVVPRGRHAPPLEVRLEIQLDRLLRAAAAVFARVGYAEASAEAISREAGMSKATFYEHFTNKEACILALWDAAAREVMLAMAQASQAAGEDPRARMRAGIGAFLDELVANPAESQTLLREIIGAGPAAARRRDTILQGFADNLVSEAKSAERKGLGPAFVSPDDAYGVVAAIGELASRQMRLGDPADVHDLEPVIERLLFGVLAYRG
jgi:AcrR family transcriptional regulator